MPILFNSLDDRGFFPPNDCKCGGRPPTKANFRPIQAKIRTVFLFEPTALMAIEKALVLGAVDLAHG